LTAANSSDLIWQVARANSAYLVKRREAGGVQFSRDPLNVGGKYSYAQSGFANEKAVGVVATKDGIQLLTKTSKNSNKPVKNVSATSYKKWKSARSVAASVAAATRGYRDDLTRDAVVKASALARARVSKKTYPVKSRK
jgi:large subunit ribosomal protein L28e